MERGVFCDRYPVMRHPFCIPEGGTSAKMLPTKTQPFRTTKTRNFSNGYAETKDGPSCEFDAGLFRSFVNFILVIANVMYMMAGLVLTSIAAVVLYHPEFRNKTLIEFQQYLCRIGFLPGDLKPTAVEMFELFRPTMFRLFVLGIIICLLSVVPLIGVVFNIKYVIYAYVGIAVIFMSAMLTVIILFFVNDKVLFARIHKFINKTMKNYEIRDGKTFLNRMAVVLMQSQMCCGYESGNDFNSTNYLFNGVDEHFGKFYTNLTYPLACCKEEQLSSELCPKIFSVNNSYIDRGCKYAVDENIRNLLMNPIYVMIAGVVLNMVILILVSVGIIIHEKED